MVRWNTFNNGVYKATGGCYEALCVYGVVQCRSQLYVFLILKDDFLPLLIIRHTFFACCCVLLFTSRPVSWHDGDIRVSCLRSEICSSDCRLHEISQCTSNFSPADPRLLCISLSFGQMVSFSVSKQGVVCLRRDRLLPDNGVYPFLS